MEKALDKKSICILFGKHMGNEAIIIETIRIEIEYWKRIEV